MYDEEIRYAYDGPAVWPYYVVAGFAITIVMCLLVATIQSIYQRISSDLRSLSPVQLWITIIPFFGSFWIFYVIHQLASSLHQEFKRRNVVEFETSPGLGMGWAFAFFFATAQLTLLIDEAIITSLLYIASVILLVIYWMKIIGFRSKLDFDAFSGASFNTPTPFPFQIAPPSMQQQYRPDVPPVPQPFHPPYEPPKSADDWNRWKPKQ